VLLITGILARQSAWIWMSPMILPVMYLYFGYEARRLERAVAAELLANGRRHGLVPVKAGGMAEERNESPASLSPPTTLLNKAGSRSS